jgi:ATP-binding cassette subfamily B protein
VHPRFRKFLSYYRPYRSLLVADLICALLVAAITLLLPLCTNYITRTVLEDPPPDALVRVLAVGGLMVLLVAVYTACNTFVDYQGHLMGALMESDMRHELFAHYQRLPFRFYDEQRTGQLMTRLSNDLFSLSELYHHGPEDLAIAALKLIGVFAILFSIDLPLTLVLLAFVPVMLVYALHFNRKMQRALAESAARIGDINAQVEDSLAGARVVKSFTNEPLETAKFSQANQRFVDSRRAGYRSEAFFSEGVIAFNQLMLIAVVVFGAVGMLRASLDAADLLTFVFCVGILADPVQRLVNFSRLYQEGVTGFNRFMELLEVTPEIQDAPDAVAIAHARGRITFEDVTFRYSDAQGDVLKNVSLDIRAGEYVALVGASGVGKSTLCALIPRFYEASSGRILLDGTDIRSITQASLRRQIGVVQQEVYLFAGTVAENIRYGRPDASEEEVVAAAQRANAHEFILALPQGYNTDIGQRGVKLSGGQRQRLSIARVFLKNPPIVIFDEATSALDNASERAVQASLEQLRVNRTTLVIAHRLSTIRSAGRILVLSDGDVVEQGAHDDLIARDGVYAGLYNGRVLV